MNEITHNQVVDLLGPVHEVKYMPGISDKEYHTQLDGVSSSGLKEYLDDPVLALQKRVLGTATSAERTERSKVALRVGSALHCAVFEGLEKMAEHYPLFSGSSRKGTTWTKFVKENEEAERFNRILNKADERQVSKMYPYAKKMADEVMMPYYAQGYQLVHTINEAGFWLKLKTLLAMMFKPDTLHLLRRPDGRYLVIISDLKTTDVSVSNDGSLGSAVVRSHYDLSACMYSTLMSMFLRVSDAFGIGCQDVQVIFNLVWISKSTLQLRYHTLYNTWGDSEWDTGGRARFLGALSNYYEQAYSLLQQKEQTPSANVCKPLPPPYNYKYAVNSCKIDSKLFTQTAATEVQLRKFFEAHKKGGTNVRAGS